MPQPLKLNRFSTLALKAMTALAGSGERLATGRLAASFRASPGHLSKVMTRLADAGLVEGRRGPGGGFCLTREPEDITLVEVLGALEPLEHIGCLWGRRGCGAACLWGDLPQRLGRTLRATLTRVTLADLVSADCQAKIARGLSTAEQ